MELRLADMSASPYLMAAAVGTAAHGTKSRHGWVGAPPRVAGIPWTDFPPPETLPRAAGARRPAGEKPSRQAGALWPATTDSSGTSFAATQARRGSTA